MRKAGKISFLCVVAFAMSLMSYNNVYATQSAISRGYIDTPVNNSTVQGNTTLSGWALNSSGVKEVQVIVDSQTVGDATLGVSRPDVNKVYPGYPGGSSSGYTYSLNTATINAGRHTITLHAIGTDGTTNDQSVAVNVQKLLSRGYIDTPANNSTVLGTAAISGWALNQSGIKEIQIQVDGKTMGDATLGISRPDVNKVYPGYISGSTSGYSYSLDTSNISVGKHTLTVHAIGNDGTTNDQSISINENKQVSRGYIDTPVNNANELGTAIISGWELNSSGIKEVQIQVDKQNVGDATLGLSRADVDKVFPNYPGGSTSGYKYNLDTSNISAGEHTITVHAIGNDGTTNDQNISFNESKQVQRMYLDTPTNNSIVQQTAKISGWALNSSRIKEVQVIVDKNVIGDATLGVDRSDVDKVYPGYPGGSTSGFTYNLDMSSINEGIHTITLHAIGNDGNTMDSTVTIDKELPHGFIDAPTNNSNILGSANIKGWALNPSGVKEVQIIVDKQVMGDATIGANRSDVNAVYPGYIGGTTSGYNYTLDTSTITAGNHVLTAHAIGNDGSTNDQSVSINVQKQAPLSYIDAPTYNSTVWGPTTISGWALNSSRVKEVQILVDKQPIGDATLGISRTDVDNTHPGYPGGSNSGFTYNLDTSNLSIGQHSITIHTIGNDGSTSDTTTSVNVKPSPIMYVDSPNANANVTSTGTIAGWALNATGTKEVRISIDGNFIGDATIGISRTDVAKAYPKYPNGVNSGFSYNFNFSSLSDVGSHTLSIQAIGNDNVSVTQNVLFYNFPAGSNFYTHYNYTLQDMITAQVNSGAYVYQNGTFVSTTNRNTIGYYANPANFTDGYGMYQFLRLDYVEGISVDDLNNILAGKGVLSGKGAQFLAAAQQNNVSPIYLVSHALLETGNGTSTLATGVSVNGKMTYNLFGIGAVTANPITGGAEYAYNHSWFSVDQAIYGGAQWISANYINNSYYKQNTLYKMRWNPASPGQHQYADDVSWAYNQVSDIKKLMDMCKNPVYKFDIPQFN